MKRLFSILFGWTYVVACYHDGEVKLVRAKKFGSTWMCKKIIGWVQMAPEGKMANSRSYVVSWEHVYGPVPFEEKM